MRKRQSRFALAIEGLVGLAMAAGAVAACSSSSDPATPSSTNDAGGASSSSSGSSGQLDASAVDAGPFPPFKEESTFECGTLSELIGGLKPGTPVDYLEIRTVIGPVALPDAGAPVPGNPSTGTPCAAEACRDALEQAVTKDGWTPNRGCGNEQQQTQFLVYSRGENAGTVGKAADVAAFLAPIESIEEARVALLAAQGIPLSCVTTPAKSGWRKNADGSFEIIAVYGQCPTQRDHYKIEADGTVTRIEQQTGDDLCVCGRRFDGLAEGPTGGASVDLVSFLAEMAYLEAASVVAFRRFEEDLVRLRAPSTLVARARASRADEIRHARMTAWLAKVHGGTVAPVEAAEARERSLFDIALENAVEGCVRETYGAVVAAYQSKNAQNPEVRRAMQIIAVDEAKHAELAHDVAAWLDRKLTCEERELIEDAKAAALADLERAAAVAPAAEVRIQAGVPDPAAALALVRGLRSLALAA